MLTYGHFLRTGEQDCSNAFSPDEFRATHDELSSHHSNEELAKLVVGRELATWDLQDWIDSQDADTFESLDPAQCSRLWLAGWRAQAITIVTEMISDARAELVERIASNASLPESWRSQ